MTSVGDAEGTLGTTAAGVGVAGANVGDDEETLLLAGVVWADELFRCPRATAMITAPIRTPTMPSRMKLRSRFGAVSPSASGSASGSGSGSGPVGECTVAEWATGGARVGTAADVEPRASV